MDCIAYGCALALIEWPKLSKTKSFVKWLYPKTNVINERTAYFHLNTNQNNIIKIFKIIINFSIHSGKNRFFLCDLEEEKVIIEGLVCHGSCSGNDKEFSNIEGSGCSSLGHYKIGNKYNGDFGTAYKLYGLDETNSNAFERFVVLHSHSCVPKREVFYEICLSLGCPTLNPEILKEIEPYLDEASKPIIIWGIK